MQVLDIFNSIQGEGKQVGKYRTFVRLNGCNLACNYCDVFARCERVVNIYTPQQMATRLSKEEGLVVWTGGEPALQQDEIYEVRPMLDWDRDFELETNGTIKLTDPELFTLITVSPKLDAPNYRAVISEYKQIDKHYDNVIFKFATDDPLNILKIIKECNLDREKVYCMAISDSIIQEGDREKELLLEAQFSTLCIRNKLNFSPRLHRLFNLD